MGRIKTTRIDKKIVDQMYDDYIFNHLSLAGLSYKYKQSLLSIVENFGEYQLPMRNEGINIIKNFEEVALKNFIATAQDEETSPFYCSAFSSVNLLYDLSKTGTLDADYLQFKLLVADDKNLRKWHTAKDGFIGYLIESEDSIGSGLQSSIISPIQSNWCKIQLVASGSNLTAANYLTLKRLTGIFR